MEIESFSWCSRPWALTYPLGRYNMETLSALLTDHLWGEFSGYWWIISGLYKLILSFYQIYMITSSIGNISALLAFCAGNSPLTGESPPPPNKRQWRGALKFSLICVWTNGCANTGDAGDLRRHCAHYDDTFLRQWYRICFSVKMTSLKVVDKISRFCAAPHVYWF